MTDLWAGAAGVFLGALAGAGLTYRLDLLKLQRERSHQLADEATARRLRRQAIASTLLIEMRNLEHVLRRFRRFIEPGNWKGESPVTLYPTLIPELLALNPANVAPVVRFYGLVRDVFLILGFARAIDGLPADEADHIHYVIRVKAAFALEALSDARDALLREGGQMPPAEAVRIYRTPDLPPLPERVFPTQFLDPDEEAEV